MQFHYFLSWIVPKILRFPCYFRLCRLLFSRTNFYKTRLQLRSQFRASRLNFQMIYKVSRSTLLGPLTNFFNCSIYIYIYMRIEGNRRCAPQRPFIDFLETFIYFLWVFDSDESINWYIGCTYDFITNSAEVMCHWNRKTRIQRRLIVSYVFNAGFRCRHSKFNPSQYVLVCSSTKVWFFFFF